MSMSVLLSDSLVIQNKAPFLSLWVTENEGTPGLLLRFAAKVEALWPFFKIVFLQELNRTIYIDILRYMYFFMIEAGQTTFLSGRLMTARHRPD